MQKLSNAQSRHLKSLAHALKPIVIIGDKGLTESVLEEIGRALLAHELIKVKIRAQDRDERDAMIDNICARTKAFIVQRVGHVVSLFKRNQEARIALPKA